MGTFFLLVVFNVSSTSSHNCGDVNFKNSFVRPVAIFTLRGNDCWRRNLNIYQNFDYFDINIFLNYVHKKTWRLESQNKFE